MTRNWHKGQSIHASKRCDSHDVRLLDNPFDFTQAFDRALKNIINTLGNRSKEETAEETVRCVGICVAILR